MLENLSGSQRLNLREAQVRFALQVANITEKHGFARPIVYVRRHEFCECLNVIGRFDDDEEQDHEAYVPIEIPSDWSEECRDHLEELFADAARVACRVALERRVAAVRVGT